MDNGHLNTKSKLVKSVQILANLKRQYKVRTLTNVKGIFIKY